MDMFHQCGLPWDAEMRIFKFVAAVDTIFSMISVSTSWRDAVQHPEAWMGTEIDLTTAYIKMLVWERWKQVWRNANTIWVGAAWMFAPDITGFNITYTHRNHLFKTAMDSRFYIDQQKHWISTRQKFGNYHLYFLTNSLEWVTELRHAEHQISLLMTTEPTKTFAYSETHSHYLNVIVDATYVETPCKLCMGWIRDFESVAEHTYLGEMGLLPSRPYFVVNTSQDNNGQTSRPKRDGDLSCTEQCIPGSMLVLRFSAEQGRGVTWKSLLQSNRDPTAITKSSGRCRRLPREPYVPRALQSWRRHVDVERHRVDSGTRVLSKFTFLHHDSA